MRRAAIASLWLILSLPPASGAQEPDSSKARPIEADLLTGIEDRAAVRSAEENQYEYRAYNYVLTQASKTAGEALVRAARHDLTYVHLFEEPAKYRGQIVHLEGRLRRLRKFDAPLSARAEGVPVLYEGWIFDMNYVLNPYCVILTELPPGVRPGEKLEYDVSFDGYFFKRFRYRDGRETQRDCPLLIGRSVVVKPNLAGDEEESAWSFSRAFLPAFFGLMVLTAVLAVGLALWFRRGDRLVQSRLSDARLRLFKDSLESLEPNEDAAEKRELKDG